MMRLCAKCGIPLRTGDHVTVKVYAMYEELKSKISYALSRPYDADGDTLQHRECTNPKYDE